MLYISLFNAVVKVITMTHIIL